MPLTLDLIDYLSGRGNKIVEAKYKVGRVGRADLAQAEYKRLDAEIALEREKAK